MSGLDHELFEMPATRRFEIGDKVLVSLIWGDEEGIVVGGKPGSILVELHDGATDFVSAARVRHA